MMATYKTNNETWRHHIDHEVGKQYVAEREAQKIAQEHANKRKVPVSVTYRHEGSKCTGCDEDGSHTETLSPLP